MMKSIIRSLIVITGLTLVWQLIITLFKLPTYILPSPLEVMQAWQSNIALILHEAIPTALETIVGLLLGVALGFSSAVIMAYFRPLKLWLFPLLIVSQVIPTFAIAPLLVIWFGYGVTSKIITTIIMIFFPITSAFFDGLYQTNKQWLDMAKTMRAKKWRTFLHIRIPAALPNLASGLRVASVIAPIGAVIGEWVGSSHGIGFLILNANARMQIDLMFAAIFTLMFFSLLLYFFVDNISTKLVTWKNNIA